MEPEPPHSCHAEGCCDADSVVWLARHRYNASIGFLLILFSNELCKSSFVSCCDPKEVLMYPARHSGKDWVRIGDYDIENSRWPNMYTWARLFFLGNFEYGLMLD